jgi:hypothetical protein
MRFVRVSFSFSHCELNEMSNPAYGSGTELITELILNSF